MKVYRIRGGGSIQDIYDKKYTLGIGISLGNKFFTVENIIKYIEWALPKTKDVLVVYVADTIHAINVEVRSRIKIEKALEKVTMQSQNLLNQIKEQVEIKFLNEKDKIAFATWKDITDDKFNLKVKFLYDLFENDKEFNFKVKQIVKNMIMNEQRLFSEKDIERMSHYVLEELPECLNRVEINKIKCDAWLYPYDGELLEFIENIQMGLVFPEIKNNILDTEPKIFIEIR